MPVTELTDILSPKNKKERDLGAVESEAPPSKLCSNQTENRYEYRTESTGQSRNRGENPGNSDRKMSEFETMSESRIVTAHGIFNRSILQCLESRQCKIFPIMLSPHM